MDFNQMKNARQSGGMPLMIRRGIMLFFLFVASVNVYDIVAYNSSSQIMVKQAWWTGDMSIHTTNGFIGQWFGDITRLDRQLSVTFTNNEDEDDVTTHAFWVRYNDGGTSEWGGTARFNVPGDDQIYTCLRAFKDEETIVKELLIPGMREICTSTSGLLSTEESYTTKRTMIPSMCSDQANNGVYLTEINYMQFKDEFGKTDRIPVYDIKKDTVRDSPTFGEKIRKPPIFSQFGITCELFLIPEIAYLGNIDNQIKEKMGFRTQLQVTDADIAKYEQQLNEVKAVGQKNVTVEEMLQEKKRTNIIQNAEAYRQKAMYAVIADSIETFNTLAETKSLTAADIKKAQGAAEKRKKEMSGDNALEIRRLAYEEAIGVWTDAIMSRAENAPQMAAGWDPNYYLNLLRSIDKQLRTDLDLNLTFHN